MVGPGVSVVISSQAIITGSRQSVQNVVSIEIPTIGDSWSTTTDSSAGGNDGI